MKSWRWEAPAFDYHIGNQKPGLYAKPFYEAAEALIRVDAYVGLPQEEPMRIFGITLLWLWLLPLQTVQIDAAEYDLYSQLINTLYDGESVVISEDTSPVEEDFYDIVKEKAPAIAEDFLRKNQKSERLEKHFKVNSEYQLISKAQLEALHRDVDDFWETFYQRYPKASGIVYLSRVGFNADQTKALVVYHRQKNWLGGYGAAVIMKKENGRWVKETALWFSQS